MTEKLLIQDMRSASHWLYCKSREAFRKDSDRI